MKQELGVRDFAFLRVVFIILQLLLSLYLAYAWDKNEYAQWVLFQTQFALIVQFNFGLPVYFNKYTAIKKKNNNQKTTLLVPWVLVMLISVIISNQIFITIWASLGIVQLTLTSGMRSLKFDLTPTLLAIFIPLAAIFSSIIFKTANALLWSYIIALSMVCTILLIVYRRNFVVPMNLDKGNILELAEIWVYNLLFYGVYEYARNQITQQASVQEKVNLGYLFILLGAVTSIWSIFSSYYYPHLLRSTMEGKLRSIKKIFTKLGLLLVSLFFAVMLLSLIESHYFSFKLRYELVYLYLLMCLAGMFGTYSVGKNELMTFFRDITIFGLIISAFSTLVTTLQIATLLFVFIILRQTLNILKTARINE